MNLFQKMRQDFNHRFGREIYFHLQMLQRTIVEPITVLLSILLDKELEEMFMLKVQNNLFLNDHITTMISLILLIRKSKFLNENILFDA